MKLNIYKNRLQKEHFTTLSRNEIFTLIRTAKSDTPKNERLGVGLSSHTQAPVNILGLGGFSAGGRNLKTDSISKTPKFPLFWTFAQCPDLNFWYGSF